MRAPPKQSTPGNDFVQVLSDHCDGLDPSPHGRVSLNEEQRSQLEHHVRVALVKLAERKRPRRSKLTLVVRVPVAAWLVLSSLSMLVVLLWTVPMIFALFVKCCSWWFAAGCGPPIDIFDAASGFCEDARVFDGKVDWLLSCLWAPIANHWLLAVSIFCYALLFGKCFCEGDAGDKLWDWASGSAARPVLDEDVVTESVRRLETSVWTASSVDNTPYRASFNNFEWRRNGDVVAVLSFNNQP